MKHRKRGRKLGRVRSQRRALMRTMLGSLIIYERIETTEAKAKELKPFVDRLFTVALRAKDSDNSDMEIFRKLEGKIPNKAIKKIKDELLDRIGDRVSGFTRIIKLSPRKSDGASMAIIELVDKIEVKDSNTKKEKKDK